MSNPRNSIAGLIFSCARFCSRLKRSGGLRAGVPLDKSHPLRSAIPQLEPLLGDSLHSESLMRALWLEIRSFAGRIGELQKTRLHRRGVVVPHRGLSGSLSPEEYMTARDGCISDMQKVSLLRPWMSTSDVLSFALAWTLGYESRGYILDRKFSLSEQPGSCGDLLHGSGTDQENAGSNYFGKNARAQ